MVAAIGLRHDNRWALGVLPLKQPFGVSWFTAYLHTFTSATGKFVQAGGVDVPTVLSMTLVITLVAFLLLLTVVVRSILALLPSFLVIWWLCTFLTAAN